MITQKALPIILLKQFLRLQNPNENDLFSISSA